MAREIVSPGTAAGSVSTLYEGANLKMCPIAVSSGREASLFLRGDIERLPHDHEVGTIGTKQGE